MQEIKYKGYSGTVSYSNEEKVYFGKIEGIDGLVNYEGKNLSEMTQAFHEAVDALIGAEEFHRKIDACNAYMEKVLRQDLLTPCRPRIKYLDNLRKLDGKFLECLNQLKATVLDEHPEGIGDNIADLSAEISRLRHKIADIIYGQEAMNETKDSAACRGDEERQRQGHMEKKGNSLFVKKVGDSCELSRYFSDDDARFA